MRIYDSMKIGGICEFVMNFGEVMVVVMVVMEVEGGG